MAGYGLGGVSELVECHRHADGGVRRTGNVSRARVIPLMSCTGSGILARAGLGVEDTRIIRISDGPHEPSVHTDGSFGGEPTTGTGSSCAIRRSGCTRSRRACVQTKQRPITPVTAEWWHATAATIHPYYHTKRHHTVRAAWLCVLCSRHALHWHQLSHRAQTL